MFGVAAGVLALVAAGLGAFDLHRTANLVWRRVLLVLGFVLVGLLWLLAS